MVFVENLQNTCYMRICPKGVGVSTSVYGVFSLEPWHCGWGGQWQGGAMGRTFIHSVMFQLVFNQKIIFKKIV